MANLVDLFDRYTGEYRWKIIPVYPRSKIPVGPGWSDRYNQGRSRHYIANHPNANLGILLGDFVDVEGDTPQANRFLDEILAGHPHPMYTSHKSVHHLFLCLDQDLTVFKHNGIEFRGHRHFSVLPPSLHAGGKPYLWVVEPCDVIPEMPDDLREFYEQNKRKKALKASFVAPACSVCGCTQPIHKKRYALEVKSFRQCDLSWECRSCRKIDVRDLCRAIRKSSRRA